MIEVQSIKLGDPDEGGWDILLVAGPRECKHVGSPLGKQRQRDQAWQIVREASDKLRELGWLSTASRNPEPVQREIYAAGLTESKQKA
jgi:hypothetical protein